MAAMLLIAPSLSHRVAFSSDIFYTCLHFNRYNSNIFELNSFQIITSLTQSRKIGRWDSLTSDRVNKRVAKTVAISLQASPELKYVMTTSTNLNFENTCGLNTG